MRVRVVIISFAWTTPALLAGAKTVTRRDWSPAHAAKFRAGDVVDAFDKLPRAHGKKIATIRITRDPYLQWTDAIPLHDYVREGFIWLDDHGQRETVARIVEYWHIRPRPVYVIEFELVEVLARDGGVLAAGGQVRDIGGCTVELIDVGREVLPG